MVQRPLGLESQTQNQTTVGDLRCSSASEIYYLTRCILCHNTSLSHVANVWAVKLKKTEITWFLYEAAEMFLVVHSRTQFH